MRKSTLIGLLAIWAGLSSTGFAQVSSFPSPPPLAPSPDQSSDSSTNPPPVAPSVPPMDSANGAGTGGAGNTPGESTGVTPSMDTGVSGSGAQPAPTFPSPSSNGTDSGTESSDTPITAATLNSMSALDDKVALEAGDRISFRVIEDRDDAVPRLVTDTGEVDFPYVGRLKVAGLTCRQVALQLKKLLEVDYYKQATVIVGLDVIVGHTEEQSHDVAWIVGQVHQVGPQELSKLQPLTVSQLILRAGGFGDFADERKVQLVHRQANNSTSPAVSEAQGDDKGQREIIDVKSIYQGNHSFDPIVEPNDLIIVPKKLVNF